MFVCVWVGGCARVCVRVCVFSFIESMCTCGILTSSFFI